MNDHLKHVQNPYSTASNINTLRPSQKATIVRWFLIVIAVAMILLSVPNAWHTFELADQEYFQIMKSRRVIYDIEINGIPVTIDEAIRRGTVSLLTNWSLAAVLLLLAKLISKTRRCETELNLARLTRSNPDT